MNTNYVYTDGIIPTFKDSYQILKPTSNVFDGYPCIKARARQYTKYKAIYAWNGNQPVFEEKINDFGLKNAKSFMHRHANQATMKMLKCFEDGDALSYRYHVLPTVFPGMPVGHDIDCFKGLINTKLIKFSHKGSHGLKLFKITDLGREVCKIADINNIFYRVVRWFKIDDEDEMIAAMMKADLNGEESYKDTMPETIIELLENLFNPESEMHKIGCCYRFMNNLINYLKRYDGLFEKFDVPEIDAWLNEHVGKYHGVDAFLKIFNQIKRKHQRINKAA